MTEKKTRSNQAADLRKQAEDIVRKKAIKSPEGLDGLSPEETRQTLHELRVHQIELEIQNEELRLTQGELAASRQEYFDLYELAPVGYIAVSEQGLIRNANVTAAALIGVEKSRLYNRPLTAFIIPEDQSIYYFHRKQLLETSLRQKCELRMMREGFPPFWARMETITRRGDDGALVYMFILTDISELRRVDNAIKNSLGLVEATLDAVDNGILVVSREGRVVKTNRRFAEMWCIPSDIIDSGEDEKLLNHILDKLSDPDAFIARVRELYNEPETESFDLVNFKDGRIFERISKPMFVAGEPKGRVWSFYDITDKKIMEKELRNSRDNLKLEVALQTEELLQKNIRLAIEIEERKGIEAVLRKREEELATETHQLAETNTTLRVLLQRREADQKEMEKKILDNIQKLVFPHLEKLRSLKLNDVQINCLDSVTANLRQVTSPFLHNLTARFADFTPREIQVSNMVREGRTSKEIACCFNSSIRSIEFHRDNIRKKLGLNQEKTNLRIFLMNLSD